MTELRSSAFFFFSSTNASKHTNTCVGSKYELLTEEDEEGIQLWFSSYFFKVITFLEYGLCWCHKQ